MKFTRSFKILFTTVLCFGIIQLSAHGNVNRDERCPVSIKGHGHFITLENSDFNIKLLASKGCSQGFGQILTFTGVSLEIFYKKELISTAYFEEMVWSEVVQRFLFKKHLLSRGCFPDTVNLLELDLKKRSMRSPLGIYHSFDRPIKNCQYKNS
jgi:hypothetical protein